MQTCSFQPLLLWDFFFSSTLPLLFSFQDFDDTNLLLLSHKPLRLCFLIPLSSGCLCLSVSLSQTALSVMFRRVNSICLFTDVFPLSLHSNSFKSTHWVFILVIIFCSSRIFIWFLFMPSISLLRLCTFSLVPS